jgi:hypothetical protein
MRVLKFTETDEAVAEPLRARMVEQINTWSRLAHLCHDPEYITQPFEMSIWKEHTTIPGLWWLDYDALYANIGDDGRKIADWFIGVIGEPGLMAGLTDCTLSLVEIDDLVWEGYLPTPPDIIMP